MKSQLLGKARTSCKECIFAVYSGNTQVGCQHGRTEKFREQANLVPARDDEKEFDVINGFCNYYRTATWAATKTDTTVAVHRETDVTLGLVVYDSFSADSQINRAIESIKEIDYDHARIKVILASYAIRGVSYLMNKTNQIIEDGFQCEAVINSSPFNKRGIDFDAFKKCVGCSYLGKMEHDSIIKPDMIRTINKSLNENLEKVILFESGGVSIMPFSVVNTEYVDYQDFHKMIDGIRPIVQKNNAYAQV